MNAEHESASLETVDLQPAEGKPYLQAYLEAYLEPHLETYLEARPQPEDPEPVPDGAPEDEEEAPDQELVDREPYLQAYLEPYLEACLEPAEPPATDLEAEPVDLEPAGPEPTAGEPAILESAIPESAIPESAIPEPADLEAPGPEPIPEPAPEPAGTGLDEPAPEVDVEPVDAEPVDAGHDDLRADQFRRRAEAARLATSIRWMPPPPTRQSWAPVASASFVAGQVRVQLVPCLRALRSVGLDGCAYQLQRLDHVLERIATVQEASVAYGPDM